MSQLPAASANSASGRLRPDGSAFEVAGYTFEANVFTGHYRAQVLGQSQSFAERIEFPAGSALRPSETLLRLLTLAISLSYFKATYSDKIEVGFALSKDEASFFAQLIENGMGEYAYVNDLPWKLTPQIIFDSSNVSDRKVSFSPGAQPLVAVGGGKDSIVTIEALKASGFEPLLYSVNDRGAIRASVIASGLTYFTVSRVIDPQLVEANAQGAPNGHVPVTAINSLIGLVAAELAGAGPVIFSNEESADHGNLTWNGREVNHQWSKSLAYEDLLRQTLEAGHLERDRFFSLLRSWREIEIAHAFSKESQYFDSFTSCNRAYRSTAGDRNMTWCGECAKCAFVFLLLASALPRQQVVEIFDKDMLAADDDEEIMAEVLGLRDQKPFDCVGEPSEAQEALLLAQHSGQWADSALVARLVASLPVVENRAPLRPADRVPEAFRAASDWVGQP